MTNEILLNATVRNDLGKGASRRLRRAGLVPAIVYGGKKEPLSITFQQNELQREMKNEAFYSQILTAKLDGKTQRFILKSLQRHPFKSVIMHLDLERVSEDKEITVHIPIHYLNADKAPGVKVGGAVQHHLIDLEITCLPADLPESVEIDLENVELDQTIHLSDLTLPKGVKSVALSHDDNKAVVSISMPKAAPVEEEETTEEVEAAASEEAAPEAEAKAEDKGEESENKEG